MAPENIVKIQNTGGLYR